MWVFMFVDLYVALCWTDKLSMTAFRIKQLEMYKNKDACIQKCIQKTGKLLLYKC